MRSSRSGINTSRDRAVCPTAGQLLLMAGQVKAEQAEQASSLSVIKHTCSLLSKRDTKKNKDRKVNRPWIDAFVKKKIYIFHVFYLSFYFLLRNLCRCYNGGFSKISNSKI